MREVPSFRPDAYSTRLPVSCVQCYSALFPVSCVQCYRALLALRCMRCNPSFPLLVVVACFSLHVTALTRLSSACPSLPPAKLPSLRSTGELPEMDPSTQSTSSRHIPRTVRPLPVPNPRPSSPALGHEADVDDCANGTSFEVQPVDTCWSPLALRYAFEAGLLDPGVDLHRASPGQIDGGAGSRGPALVSSMVGDTALLHPRQPTDEEIESYDVWFYVVAEFGKAWPSAERGASELAASPLLPATR